MRTILIALFFIMSCIPSFAEGPNGVFKSQSVRFSIPSLNKQWKRATWNIKEIDFEETELGRRLIGVAKMSANQSLNMKAFNINYQVNKMIAYRLDDGDHFANASDTLHRGVGDCEDYAILKAAALVAIGVPLDDLFLIVVRVENVSDLHAVLAIKSGREYIILDNRAEFVYLSSQSHDYQALYSMGFGGSWVHAYSGPIASGQ